MNNSQNKQNKNQLVIISGASRGIGKAFMNHYASKPNTYCIGLSKWRDDGNYYSLDLLDKKETNTFVNFLVLSNIERIIHIHSIGIDKFEPDGKPHIDNDRDGLDDEVYASNVTAFQNIAEPLIARATSEGKYLNMINIGSISDIYEVPFWHSFSASKNIVRKYMKSHCNNQIKGTMLNISSTLDDEGRKYGRPFAGTIFWQKADEFVKKSVKYIDDVDSKAGYVEADFFKYDPTFRPDYFTNLDRLYKYWQKDMGFEGKPIPHGIRI